MASRRCLFLCLVTGSAFNLGEDVVASRLKEILFIADPLADSSTFDRSWGGWAGGSTGYHGSTADGSEATYTYGKQVAYDVMCLAGLRFREGSNVSAAYELSDYFRGASLVQIVEECSSVRSVECDTVGQLLESKGVDGPAVDLPVYTGNAVFEPDSPSPASPSSSWVFGAGSLNPAATSTVAIEGYPALNLLFRSDAGDDAFSNIFLGWFRAGHIGAPGADGKYYGKQPAYDSAPLYTILFEDDYGRSAEYIINEDYAGMCLLEMVQKCMPDAWARRRNDGSQRWMEGHCEIGTLVAASNLPDVADQLRLGVGDLEAASRVQYRDWALFMPLLGNGGGNFRQNVWAFGSKGGTNTGGLGGMVSIYGGPSLACGTSLPEKVICFEAGMRVMFYPESKSFADVTKSCGTVESRACTNDINGTRVLWDDGEARWASAAALESLVECQPLPSFEDSDDVFLELLFAADGMDPTYSNRYRGWYEQPRAGRRLEANSEDAGGVQPAYWSMCLAQVKLADDSGAYARFALNSDHAGMALGPIVAATFPSREDRRNVDSAEWTMGHRTVGDLMGSAGVANVSDGLRIGVGDALSSSDPRYPQPNDWAVFMPVKGNGEHYTGLSAGAGNFATGVWAFGSKGVANSLHDGPVYIYGYPAFEQLFYADASDTRFDNSFLGWAQAGYLTEDDSKGKFSAYDDLKLGHLWLMDMEGNFAAYDLSYPYAGMTMLEIVQTCFDGSDPCEVGSLLRFGGPNLVSVSNYLRIGVGRNTTDDWAVFTPLYSQSAGFEASMVWSVGSKTVANPAVAAGQVGIFGGPYDCKSPSEMLTPPAR